MKYQQLSLRQKVSFCGAIASIIAIPIMLAMYVHPRSESTRQMQPRPVRLVGQHSPTGHEGYDVSSENGRGSTATGSSSLQHSRSVRLGAGNIDDLNVKLRGDMLELRFKNNLWFSSLLISYDGVSQGKMKQLDSMTLTVPATPGTHTLMQVAEQGSFDAGRTWYRQMIVE